MSFSQYSKTATVPATTSTPAAGAVIGNPVSSVFASSQLDYVHEMIKLFIKLESDLADHGNQLLTVISGGSTLESFFIPDLTEFKTTPLQLTWTAVNANLEVPLAERRYKFGDSESLPLYIKITFGLMGVSATAGSYNSTRPYYSIEFSSNSTFSSIIKKRNFAVTCMSTQNVAVLANFESKLFYAFNENSISIYPLGLYATSLNSNTLGRNAGFSAPYNVPAGFILNKSKCYAALSSQSFIATALLPCKFIGISTTIAASALGVISGSASNIDEPALIVTPDLYETRSPALPPVGGTVAAASPARKFASPYVMTLSNGTVIAFDGLLWMSDIYRDRIDFMEGSYQIGGQPVNAITMPLMMQHVPDGSAWLSNIGAFVLGLKK